MENRLTWPWANHHMKKFIIRNIQPSDNERIAEIIKAVLTEFNANLPGTVFYDPEIYHLSKYYQQEGSAYFVAEVDSEIVGGSGIGPLSGSKNNICELQKLYVLPEGRGIGLGKSLIEQCLQFAKEAGYNQCYLESLPQLDKGVKLYEQFGFRYMDHPLGQTGHGGCNLWMIKDLS